MLGSKPAECTHCEFTSYGVPGERTVTWQFLSVQNQSLSATHGNVKRDVRNFNVFSFRLSFLVVLYHVIHLDYLWKRRARSM